MEPLGEANYDRRLSLSPRLGRLVLFRPVQKMVMSERRPLLVEKVNSHNQSGRRLPTLPMLGQWYLPPLRGSGGRSVDAEVPAGECADVRGTCAACFRYFAWGEGGGHSSCVGAECSTGDGQLRSERADAPGDVDRRLVRYCLVEDVQVEVIEDQFGVRELDARLPPRQRIAVVGEHVTIAPNALLHELVIASTTKSVAQRWK